MAEQEETNLDEEQIEEEEQESVKKSKAPLKLIVIIILAIVLAGGGFFLWKSGALSGLKGKGKGSQAIAAKPPTVGDKQDIGPIYNLETFIVNLVDPHGKKYLKVRMDLELDIAEAKIEIDKRLPQFRDTIITLLSGKNFEEVSTFEGKFQMRAEMISMLNQFLATGMITNIYFMEFIVQ